MAVSSAALSTDALAGIGISQAASASNPTPAKRPDEQQNQDQDQNASAVVTLSQNAQKLFQQSRLEQSQSADQARQNQEQSGSANAVGNAANPGTGAESAGGSPGIQFVPGESKGGYVNTYA